MFKEATMNSFRIWIDVDIAEKEIVVSKKTNTELQVYEGTK